jgi:putative transposase
MTACSLDLRHRIVATYEEGSISIRKVAERFKVSNSVVQNLLNLKKQTGTLLPKEASGGKKSKLSGYEEQIAQMVAEHPDYTLAEYCEDFAEKTEISVSISVMCRALQKQNLTVKKNKA